MEFSLDVPPGTPDELVTVWRHQIEIQAVKLDEQILSRMIQQSVLILLGVGLFALVFGYLVADRALRPVANASHQLRTPLTINRTVLEIALSDPAASPDLKALARTLLEVNARNEKLIEGLLLLARSERELARRKPVDIDDVALTAVEQLTPVADQRGVTVVSRLGGTTMAGEAVVRVDSANGSGLGLSIVRAVVQAHGGEVTATPREGGGLSVTISLPGR
ncbi:histidine kinase dimerization/phospho-acceptor domain-containing protein [Nonomuraea sp. NPDC001684]